MLFLQYSGCFFMEINDPSTGLPTAATKIRQSFAPEKGWKVICVSKSAADGCFF